MAWIKTIDVDAADGPLGRAYQAAIKRAGRVFNIVKLQSLNPGVLQSSMAFYMSVMQKASPLSRARRELIATVVSRANNCHYWTQAHAQDLRAEVQDDALVEAVKDDYRTADLSPADRALCDYAVKLTGDPGAMTDGDVRRLRDHGFDDRAIHDAAQVAAYFNYINRVADGLGVDLEPEMSPYERRIPPHERRTSGDPP